MHSERGENGRHGDRPSGWHDGRHGEEERGGGRRRDPGVGGDGRVQRGHWSQRRLPALTAVCAGLAVWLAQVVEAATR